MSFSLSGLASGLDTATIIDQLMKLERIPYTKLEQRQSEKNADLAIIRSINTKLNTLRNATDDLLLKSNFNLRSGTNSDDKVLKVTASETAAEASYTIKVTQLATRHAMKSQEFAKDGTSLVEDKKVQVAGKEFTLRGKNNEEIMTNLMNDINKSSGIGAKASIIQSSDNGLTFVLTSDKTGEASAILFNDTEDGDFQMTTSVAAKDAKLNINGVDITSSVNELNNVVTGISLTLSKTGDATVSIAKDVDKIADKIQAFVNAYNDVTNTIRSNNGKGKSLQGDSTLRSLQDQLSTLFNRKVDDNSKYNFMNTIGLEIDKGKLKASEMTGTISFDKEKFKAALLDNPDEVYNLFAHDDNSKDNKDGIAKLFSDSLRNWTRAGTGFLTTKIEGYNSEITFMKKQMDDLQTRLGMKEEAMKKQFIAMEKALVQLQGQQSWMNSQLASMYASR